ncbi:ParB/Srx family N-terminal domain-containing protein, partial [Klebsiella pneumoniae]|nr:ParB/Srx family N-terminal domain-containing protein [Klebsiella pneumoniae]
FDAPESSGNIGCSWTLYGEDFPDLVNPDKVRLVDWWWGGSLLLGRYPIQPDAGRLKWWRKKCREGALPPVLVWYIAGLGSFVILDGHYRLQAAIAEEIPLSFLVLSELQERD